MLDSFYTVVEQKQKAWCWLCLLFFFFFEMAVYQFTLRERPDTLDTPVELPGRILGFQGALISWMNVSQSQVSCSSRSPARKLRGWKAETVNCVEDWTGLRWGDNRKVLTQWRRPGIQLLTTTSMATSHIDFRHNFLTSDGQGLVVQRVHYGGWWWFKLPGVMYYHLCWAELVQWPLGSPRLAWHVRICLLTCLVIWRLFACDGLPGYHPSGGL
jgi:hypothetical protein